jgi:hypothetical protein
MFSCFIFQTERNKEGRKGMKEGNKTESNKGERKTRDRQNTTEARKLDG